MTTRRDIYRITGIRPWASEGTNEVPQALRTFFEGKEVSIDELRAVRETADIKAVSQRVGSANVSITLGTYAHVSPDQHQEVAKKVGRALFGQRAQDVV